MFFKKQEFFENKIIQTTFENKSSKLQVQPFSKCSNTMEQLAETCVATCSHEKHYRLPTHFGVIEMLDEKDGDKFTIEDYQRKFLINPETPVYKTLIQGRFFESRRPKNFDQKYSLQLQWFPCKTFILNRFASFGVF